MPDTNYEHIELYLNDDLSPEEKKVFEQRLKEESALQEELRIYKEVNGILSRRINPSEDEQHFRDMLQEKQAEYFSSGSKVVQMTSRRTRWYAIASVAAVVLIMITWWGPWQQTTLNQYGQIEMTPPTVRSDEQDNGLTEAAQLFNKNKYKEALPLLDKIVQANPSDSRSRFYRGVTLLHLDQEGKAREDLNTIYEGESIYKYDAAYFMALSYLENNKDSARTWLEKIPQDAPIYSKAEKLLKKVGK